MTLEEIITWGTVKNVFDSTEIEGALVTVHKLYQGYIFGNGCRAVFLYRIDEDGSHHLLRGRLDLLHVPSGKQPKDRSVTLQILEDILNDPR